MNPLQGVFDDLYEQVGDATGRIGLRVDVAALGVTDRAGHLPLAPPGLISPNGACRMVRAADGWIAVNLARNEDHDLIPAWLHGAFGEESWALIERLAPARPRADLIADATLLGLPVSAVGEVSLTGPGAFQTIEGPQRTRLAGGPLKVIDLSALWAGPMCGAILAALGADVVKVETMSRPDPTRTATPGLFARLNGAKTDITIDLADAAHRAWLRQEVLAADLVISSARPRGLASLGLSPREMLQATPGGVWVAITGHGWHGALGDRVAFGDDAAAAGGLVRWTDAGEPHFLGDALSDPLTGMVAATHALAALTERGGQLVCASLAHVASGVAFRAGLRRAA